MIGIDVIDLTYPDNFTKHSVEQYSSRILHCSEISICSDLQDLIRLWCIKESLYKCWCNGGGEPFYNPKRIQITSLGTSSKTFVGNIGNSVFYGNYRANKGTIVSISTAFIEDLEKIKVYEAEWTTRGNETTFLFGSPVHVRWLFQEHVNQVEAGKRLFGYSRSHHGNRYASVILPIT